MQTLSVTEDSVRPIELVEMVMDERELRRGIHKNFGGRRA